MKALCKSVLGVTLVALLLLAGCGSNAGSEYIGKWVNVKDSSDTMEIERNGQSFIVRGEAFGEPTSFPATLENGVLQLSGPSGTLSMAIDKASGHLIIAGEEYKRVN